MANQPPCEAGRCGGEFGTVRLSYKLCFKKDIAVFSRRVTDLSKCSSASEGLHAT